MPNPDRVAALIRTRWAFALGLVLGGTIVHLAGLAISIGYGAGVLTMGLVASLTDAARVTK